MQFQKNKTIKAAYALSGRTGSLMYMAPEVLHCQPYNEKADVFSFALIMYEVRLPCPVPSRNHFSGGYDSLGLQQNDSALLCLLHG